MAASHQLFYRWPCIYVNVTLPIHSTFSSPQSPCPQVHSLLHLYSCPANRFNTTLSWHVRSISLTRDQTQAPCIGSTESQPPGKSLSKTFKSTFNFLQKIILSNIQMVTAHLSFKKYSFPVTADQRFQNTLGREKCGGLALWTQLGNCSQVQGQKMFTF